MEKGFIRLSRSFFNNKIWKSAREYSLCEAWLDLIQSAQFESETATTSIGGHEVTSKRGQYPASVRFLAKRWGRTEKWVRVNLKKLEDEGMIEVDVSQGISVITLVNYDKYNPVSEADCGMPQKSYIDTCNDIDYSLLQEYETRERAQSSLTPPLMPSENTLNGNKENMCYSDLQGKEAQQTAHLLKNIDKLGHKTKERLEYYSSSTTNERMCAYEEKSEFNFSSELRNEVFSWERAAMQLNRTVEQLKKMQGKFDFDCETEQKGHFDYNAYKRHFRNWLRIQIEKQDHAAKNITGNFTSKEAANRAVIDDYSRLAEFEKGVHEHKPDLFLCAEEL